jgi:periplasmic divalent cation tolerance protein
MECIEVYWTCGSLQEARKIAQQLVSEHLVACAQIIPWIESVFIWNNQLETAQETKVIFKTVSSNYEKIKEFIKKNCSYEVPEITFSKLDGGNSEYLNWVRDATK